MQKKTQLFACVDNPLEIERKETKLHWHLSFIDQEHPNMYEVMFFLKKRGGGGGGELHISSFGRLDDSGRNIKLNLFQGIT